MTRFSGSGGMYMPGYREISSVRSHTNSLNRRRGGLEVREHDTRYVTNVFVKELVVTGALTCSSQHAHGRTTVSRESDTAGPASTMRDAQ